MVAQTDVAKAIARQHFFFFVIRAFKELYPDQELLPSEYLQAMTYPLQQVAESDLRRLIINIAPRHLKSFCASVALPAWLLGRDQTTKMIVVSYSAVLAKDLTRLYRRLLAAPYYQSLFPNVAIAQSNDLETHLAKGGFRVAVSLDGSLTGRGGDLIIIDDPQNAGDMGTPVGRDRFKVVYDDALYSRLDNKRTGRIVLVTQRLHEDDATAHLLTKADNWRHLKLPALAQQSEEIVIGPGRNWHRTIGQPLVPHRETPEMLERIRHDVGPANFAAQYLQEPVPAAGTLFRLERIQRYSTLPDRENFEHIVQSWDTAYTPEALSDYSVCTSWGFYQNQWYLLDVHRAKLEFPELKAQVIAQRLRFRASRVIIERTGAGLSLLQQLNQESRFRGPCPWTAYQPRLDKVSRANGVLGKIEEGRILLPEQAPWLQDFLKELRAFPNGRHDDQVDSMVQFIDAMTRVRGYLDGRRPYDMHDRPNYM
ncbi:MAG: phage terminase large subunit [Ferrovibrio sp.]|uniref:phage terminase large subunit n=1 Tax=Ferrovibrio sp. TaxID=1917215 RepID=UPI003918BF6A